MHAERMLIIVDRELTVVVSAPIVATDAVRS